MKVFAPLLEARFKVHPLQVSMTQYPALLDVSVCGSGGGGAGSRQSISRLEPLSTENSFVAVVAVPSPTERSPNTIPNFFSCMGVHTKSPFARMRGNTCSASDQGSTPSPSFVGVLERSLQALDDGRVLELLLTGAQLRKHTVDLILLAHRSCAPAQQEHNAAQHQLERRAPHLQRPPRVARTASGATNLPSASTYGRCRDIRDSSTTDVR